MFTQDEAKALVAAVRLAQAWLDPALAQGAEDALGKILSVLPSEARVAAESLALYAPPAGLAAPTQRTLQSLREAVQARCKLRISYRDLSEQASERTLRPLGCDWPYGARPTWLLTHRKASAFAPLPPAVQLSADGPAQLLRQWQALGLERVWLVGGGQVAAQFLQAGCLHELMLALMPVTLGRGIALFDPAHCLGPVRWECLSLTPQALGVQAMRYEIHSV